MKTISGSIGKSITRRRPGSEQGALRSQILAAARVLQSQGGDKAVTMRAVALAVGLSAMGLYRYFPHKGALLQGVWNEVLQEALVASLGSLREDDTPIDRLLSLCGAYIDYWLANPQGWSMIIEARRAPSDSDLFALGPAAEFRVWVRGLVDACLPWADDATRRRAHDVCRCKVMGCLFLSIGLGTSSVEPRSLRAAVLDDIARQFEDLTREK